MIYRGHPLYEYDIDKERKEITIYDYMPHLSAKNVEEDIEYVLRDLYDQEYKNKQFGSDSVDVNEFTINYPIKIRDKKLYTRRRIRALNGEIAEVLVEEYEGETRFMKPL